MTIDAETLIDSSMPWFRKSSYSGASACVEVAFLSGGEVLVRDSKQSEGYALRFSRMEWNAFTAGVCAGEFDFPDNVSTPM